MVDPNEAFELLEKYYATVTPEQLKEDMRRALPQGEELHEAMAWLECMCGFAPGSLSPDDHESN